MSYILLDHSADIAIQVEGDTAEEFYLSLFQGVYHLLIGKPMESSEWLANEGITVEEVEIVGSGFDSEERLVSIVNEFLFLIQHKGKLPIEIKKITIEEESVKARILVCSLPSDFALAREIKSATYHHLQIKKSPIWQTKLVLDV